MALSLLAPCPARAEDAAALAALNKQVGELYKAGKYDEAVAIARQSLVLAERLHGPDHPDVGMSLNNLAVLYERQGRYAEAEPLFLRSLALYEKALGPDHPDVGSALNNLAALYLVQRQWARAADPWRRSAALTVL